MNISPVPSTSDDPPVPIEDLAGDKHLTKRQKIHEASQEFESIMLQQILSEMQKPVIKSEFTDDSTASGIYQDYISHTLAESMAKTGALGFAKIFEQQLSPPPPRLGHAVSTPPGENASPHNAIPVLATPHEQSAP